MRDYTRIEAWRRADDLTVAVYADRLVGQTKAAFAALHGLIEAVEKEAGKLPDASEIPRGRKAG